MCAVMGVVLMIIGMAVVLGYFYYLLLLKDHNMTRINLVDPLELMDSHLLAEYREIRLLCANITRMLNGKRGITPSRIPERFTLNRGHVLFSLIKGYTFTKDMIILDKKWNEEE